MCPGNTNHPRILAIQAGATCRRALQSNTAPCWCSTTCSWCCGWPCLCGWHVGAHASIHAPTLPGRPERRIPAHAASTRLGALADRPNLCNDSTTNAIKLEMARSSVNTSRVTAPCALMSMPEHSNWLPFGCTPWGCDIQLCYLTISAMKVAMRVATKVDQ